jgi:O-antigen/teichoic acid export membrane protein
MFAYFWNMVGKWSARLIGLASTIILARLLSPDHFGIVAIAMLCVGFFEIFTDMGIKRYLLIHSELTDQLLNSCWTLSLIIRTIVVCILLITANYAASLLSAPKSDLAIMAIAAINFCTAFKNIGVVKLERALNYKKINLINIFSKVIGTTTTLIYVYFSPSYWALIAGIATSTLSDVIGSYFIYSYRPKVNFQFDHALFKFSFFILLRSLLGFTRSKLDTMLVSRFFGEKAVGQFTIAQEFATLPFTEIVSPATQTLLPGLAKLKNNTQELLDKTYKYLALVYLLLLPSVAGIDLIAEQFTFLVLGEQWTGAAEIMRALAYFMLLYPLTSVMNNLLDYANKTHISIYLDIFSIVLLLVAVYLTPLTNVADFAWLRIDVAMALLVITLITCHIILGLKLPQVIMAISLPLISTLIMHWVCYTLFQYTDLTFTHLLLMIISAALSYSLCITILVLLTKKHLPVWLFYYQLGNNLLKNILRAKV